MTNKTGSHGVSPVDIHNASHEDVGARGVAEGDELSADRDAEKTQQAEDDEAAQVVDVAYGEEETRRPRICRRPLAPTKEMVEEHNRTHAEYRDWCPHCRAGKSTGLHHRQGDPAEDKLGVTDQAFDYLSCKHVKLSQSPSEELTYCYETFLCRI